MQNVSIHHPALGKTGHIHYRGSEQENQALMNEVRDTTDKFTAMDGGAKDLQPRPGYVTLKSRGTTVNASYSDRTIDRGSYRDSQGYLESCTRNERASANCVRTDVDHQGRPIRQISMQYLGSGNDVLVCKTITDRSGTSVATGGTGRGYEVDIDPTKTIGKSLNSLA